MRLSRPPHACVDTRERLSRALDEQLPELEHARLQAHLDGCPACRSYQAAVADVTQMLRADELEHPTFSIALPRRRRVPIRALQATAAAAAIALVTTLATAPATRGPSATSRSDRSLPQRAFVVRDGKFVPAGNDPAQRLTPARIAL